jgi:hypothetical protein
MSMEFTMTTGPSEDMISITPASTDRSDDSITVTVAAFRDGEMADAEIVLSQDDVGRLMAGLRSVAMYAAALRFAPEATP